MTNQLRQHGRSTYVQNLAFLKLKYSNFHCQNFIYFLQICRYCDKITVRNVKTEKNWFFYVSTWFNSKKHKKRHEFLVATTEYVRKRSEKDVAINCQHYCYQMQRHHSYISPFIYPSPERITLMFTEWMSYMLILICLYGFLSISDPGKKFAYFCMHIL